jgi:uncharacterized membrane protein (UPF0136 family)
MSPPLIHQIAAAITAVYGIVSIVYGTRGYVEKSSVASIVAGGIAGVILLVCAAGVLRYPVWSLIVAMIVALLLLVRFGINLVRGHSEMTPLAYQTALVMIIGGGIVIVLGVLALVLQSGGPGTKS